MFVKENNKEKIVEYLPQEILRPTKFLLARGAVMRAEILCFKYESFPLVQEELELSYFIFVSKPPTVLNENLISRYKSLVASLHVEPLKEMEDGSFKSKKETDFSVDPTTKARSNKEQKITRNECRKNKAAKKKLAQSKVLRALGVVEYAFRCTRILTSECVVILKIISTLFGCGRVCHNCALHSHGQSKIIFFKMV